MLRRSRSSAGHRITRTLLYTPLLAAALAGLFQSVHAQEAAPKSEPSPAPTTAVDLNQELEKLRKRVADLTEQVNRLKAEVAKLDKYRQIDYTRDLMIKEEQRIRSLQSDLTDLANKEAPLRKRLDEIETQQRPDRIERSLAGVGSVKPEEDRDAIRRQLSNEKRQIQTQLESIQSNRSRIQPMITNAEESIARLKRRLAELSHQ